ncbi:UNKNOWN [Stylonychia lemnae]|uniref:Serine aminopeptidase S33 domain-containing protein n=1 Tax=Stylonychia lemnae TaxID=5949 RepID=A0A078A4E3_STYLE|nr:UNKNOWN [Stylonychia lemnae]|eukprot:CDW76358.1 UNKNOWN [Stylonychia lemnae]
MESENQESQAQLKKPREVDFRARKFPVDNFVECLNVDGVSKLHTYRWPVDGTSAEKPPKAVIIMFHGFGSYVGKYTHMAHIFVERGYEVCGLDCMGFGNSEGIRGFIKDQGEFQRDGFNFVVKAKNFYNELYGGKKVPMIGWGYSQGGKLVLGIQELLQNELQDSFEGMILNTPNLKVDTSHLDEDFMKMLSEISDPLQTIPWPFKPLKDSDFLLGYVKDELQFLGPHYGKTYYENIEIQQHIKDNYKNITVPVQLVMAKGDSVLINDDMVQMMESLSTPEDKKEIKVYEGDHYIMVDGWLYEEIITNQINFLDRVLQ